jgi:hypothetical protein
MYLQKVISTKKCFVDVLMIISENSRIRIRIRIRTRIHYSEVWIRGSGVVPKFHGSATLIESTRAKNRSIKPGKKLWTCGYLIFFQKRKSGFWLCHSKKRGTCPVNSWRGTDLIWKHQTFIRNIQHFLLFWIIRSALLLRYWLFFRNEVPFRYLI